MNSGVVKKMYFYTIYSHQNIESYLLLYSHLTLKINFQLMVKKIK